MSSALPVVAPITTVAYPANDHATYADAADEQLFAMWLHGRSPHTIRATSICWKWPSMDS